MHIFIEILSKFGISGLLFTMAIEGLSVPIPGIIVVLTLGYILNLGLVQTLIVSFFMSALYSISSFLPYNIGYKLEDLIRKRYSKQIDAAQHYFNKYGESSIAILRPFAIGNYISYLAGISKVNKWKFALLTFAGIYPWCVIMLLIGKISRGNIKYAIDLAKSYSIYLYLLAVIIALIVSGIIIYKRYMMKRKKTNN
jgi:membrane protein DedA with SNARE-associated domain